MEDYLIGLLKFEHLAQKSIDLSMVTSGREVRTWREEFGSHIFVKICATSIAILKLLPRSKYYFVTKEFEVWDISSVCCLSRSLIDSYNSFFYLIVDDVDEPELEFRFILWNLHSESERFAMLDLMGLTEPQVEEAGLSERNNRLEGLKMSIEEWKNKLRNNGFYQRLPANLQGDYISGSKGLFLTNSAISERAGIAPAFYKATYKYLSNYVHTYAFSISQIASFRAGNLESLQLFKRAIGDCTGYLCFALRDFVKVFPDQAGTLTAENRRDIENWEFIFRNIVELSR